MKKYIIEKVKKIIEQETSYYNLKNITDINKEYINSPEFNEFIDTLLNPDKKIIFENRPKEINQKKYTKEIRKYLNIIENQNKETTRNEEITHEIIKIIRDQYVKDNLDNLIEIKNQILNKDIDDLKENLQKDNKLITEILKLKNIKNINNFINIDTNTLSNILSKNTLDKYNLNKIELINALNNLSEVIKKLGLTIKKDTTIYINNQKTTIEDCEIWQIGLPNNITSIMPYNTLKELLQITKQQLEKYKSQQQNEIIKKLKEFGYEYNEGTFKKI